MTISGKKIKIFWSHPRLMDYRKPLFELVAANYDVTFFFHIKETISNNFKKYYVQRHKFTKGFNLKNFNVLLQGLKNADIFISSFLTNRYSKFGLFLKWALKTKVIIWEEISPPVLESLSISEIKKMQIAAKRADAFFVMGEPQKNTLLELNVPSEKIFIANEYSGIDYNEITPKSIEGLSLENKKVVLYLGRFIEIKGINYLIDAFQKIEEELDNAVLIIAGFGPLESQLKNYAQEKKLKNIVFLQRVDDIKEKKYLFEKADVLVSPSFVLPGKVVEAGPMIILEALSAGLPVIGTIGHNTKYLKDGINGFVVEQKNSHAIYESLMKVLSWPDKTQVKQRVLEEYRKIKGFDNQLQILKKAINYCLNNS